MSISPSSPRTPERNPAPLDSDPCEDFSLIEVNKKSPPKFRIHSVQSSDEEDPDCEDEMVSLLAREEKIKGLALEVKFNNPKTKEPVTQSVPLLDYKWNNDKTTLHCIFDLQNSTPIFFSSNKEARFSPIRIVYKPEKKESRVIRIYSTYQCEPEKKSINSLNGRLKSTFRLLNKEEKETLFPKTKCAKRLFSDPESPKPYEIHVENSSIRLGGVVVLTQIEIDLKRDLL